MWRTYLCTYALENLSNTHILTFVLGALKNRLQGNGSCEHPWHFFHSYFQFGKLEKLSHPSISILTPVLVAQKNRLNEAIILSIQNMFLNYKYERLIHRYTTTTTTITQNSETIRLSIKLWKFSQTGRSWWMVFHYLDLGTFWHRGVYNQSKYFEFPLFLSFTNFKIFVKISTNFLCKKWKIIWVWHLIRRWF